MTSLNQLESEIQRIKEKFDENFQQLQAASTLLKNVEKNAPELVSTDADTGNDLDSKSGF